MDWYDAYAAVLASPEPPFNWVLVEVLKLAHERDGCHFYSKRRIHVKFWLQYRWGFLDKLLLIVISCCGVCFHGFGAEICSASGCSIPVPELQNFQCKLLYPSNPVRGTGTMLILIKFFFPDTFTSQFENVHMRQGWMTFWAWKWKMEHLRVRNRSEINQKKNRN